MSKTNFVEYGDKGFWAYDVALDIFLKHLIDVAEALDSHKESDWLRKAIRNWRGATLPDMGLTLDKDWDDSQIRVFIELANKACHELEQHKLITVNEVHSWPPILDGYQIETRGSEDIETGPIFELGKAVIGLADGSLPDAPEGTWWFIGSPGGRATIRMRTGTAG